jgi:DNA helicase IV
VLDAQTSRGLEFDAVVVVEPAAILDDAARGLRLLYVAITRPTRQLAVVSSRPLPDALAEAAAAA